MVKIPQGERLGYLAALIDGEGSIGFTPTDGTGRPHVTIYNTSRDLMRWLMREVGGHFGGHDTRGRQICYSWSISAAADVLAVCEAVAPLLIVKKVPAYKVIKHLKTKYSNLGW